MLTRTPGEAWRRADKPEGRRAELLRLPYHPDLRLELYAHPLADLFPHQFDELESVSCCAAAEVDQVVGVDGGDLDLAHPRAFEAGRLYDAAGEVSLGDA